MECESIHADLSQKEGRKEVITGQMERKKWKEEKKERAVWIKMK